MSLLPVASDRNDVLHYFKTKLLCLPEVRVLPLKNGSRLFLQLLRPHKNSFYLLDEHLRILKKLNGNLYSTGRFESSCVAKLDESQVLISDQSISNAQVLRIDDNDSPWVDVNIRRSFPYRAPLHRLLPISTRTALFLGNSPEADPFNEFGRRIYQIPLHLEHSLDRDRRRLDAIVASERDRWSHPFLQLDKELVGSHFKPSEYCLTTIDSRHFAALNAYGDFVVVEWEDQDIASARVLVSHFERERIKQFEPLHSPTSVADPATNTLWAYFPSPRIFVECGYQVQSVREVRIPKEDESVFGRSSGQLLRSDALGRRLVFCTSCGNVSTETNAGLLIVFDPVDPRRPIDRTASLTPDGRFDFATCISDSLLVTINKQKVLEKWIAHPDSLLVRAAGRLVKPFLESRGDFEKLRDCVDVDLRQLLDSVWLRDFRLGRFGASLHLQLERDGYDRSIPPNWERLRNQRPDWLVCEEHGVMSWVRQSAPGNPCFRPLVTTACYGDFIGPCFDNMEDAHQHALNSIRAWYSNHKF